MKKILLVAIACAIGASACSGTREPTDAQLGTLLRSERADPADAKAVLDSPAVECLRAWSGDAELQKNLPIRSSSENGRASCRSKLDGWIADAARNPDKFTFADLSAPKTVKRAVQLLASSSVAALGDNAPVPKALTKAAAVPTYSAPATAPAGLGAAGAKLQEAESLCQQIAQKAAVPGASPRLTQFAKFCSGNLGGTRTKMERFAQSGNSEAVDALGVQAEGLAGTARKLLAESAGGN